MIRTNYQNRSGEMFWCCGWILGQIVFVAKNAHSAPLKYIDWRLCVLMQLACGARQFKVFNFREFDRKILPRLVAHE